MCKFFGVYVVVEVVLNRSANGRFFAPYSHKECRKKLKCPNKEERMSLIRTIILVGVALLFSCSDKALNFDSSKASTSSFSIESSGAAATPETTSVPADPPPITLGSYPWIIMTKVTRSLDQTMTTVEGLVLDEDDPPGIYTFSGYLRVGRSSKVTYPIIVLDRVKGKISFQIPTALFDPDNLTAVMTGPGYTNIDFPVCED